MRPSHFYHDVESPTDPKLLFCITWWTVCYHPTWTRMWSLNYSVLSLYTYPEFSTINFNFASMLFVINVFLHLLLHGLCIFFCLYFHGSAFFCFLLDEILLLVLPSVVLLIYVLTTIASVFCIGGIHKQIRMLSAVHHRRYASQAVHQSGN